MCPRWKPYSAYQKQVTRPAHISGHSITERHEHRETRITGTILEVAYHSPKYPPEMTICHELKSVVNSTLYT